MSQITLSIVAKKPAIAIVLSPQHGGAALNLANDWPAPQANLAQFMRGTKGDIGDKGDKGDTGTLGLELDFDALVSATLNI